jgi:hypothetical protein
MALLQQNLCMVDRFTGIARLTLDWYLPCRKENLSYYRNLKDSRLS